MTLTAGILNTKVDANGDMFSNDALQRMVEDVDQVPLKFNFQQTIGTASNFRVVGGMLICDVELTDEGQEIVVAGLGFVTPDTWLKQT